MTDKLLPCPFCGSEDVEIQGKPAILDALDSVFCNECTADAPYPVWNTRAALAAPVQDGYALVPVEPKTEMIEAAEEAYMPFGDMDLALRMAILAAPKQVKV